MEILWILLAPVVIFLIWVMGIYNGLVQSRETVKKGLFQIDVQLKRRHDLIPNLVEAVKGYMAYEKDTLQRVIQARQIAVNAANVQDKIQSENTLTSSLRGLLAVAENYPNLKADQSFLELQAQLEGTENRIAVERMRYNQAVQQFNTYQQSLFGSFFASMTHLTQPAVYFKAPEEAQAAPVVKF